MADAALLARHTARQDSETDEYDYDYDVDLSDAETRIVESRQF